MQRNFSYGDCLPWMTVTITAGAEDGAEIRPDVEEILSDGAEDQGKPDPDQAQLNLYEPSEIQTGSGGCSAAGSKDPVSADYDTDRVLQSAWKSLPAETHKLPWETGSWDKFLDPERSALDIMVGSFKRPLPVRTFNAEATDLDRRVAAKTFPLVKDFLSNIRDVPEQTWREERESQWETSIRWVSVLESWDERQVELTRIFRSKTRVEKAQIVVDISNSLSEMGRFLARSFTSEASNAHPD